MPFEPRGSSVITFVVSLMLYVVWRGWACLALEASGVSVPFWSRGAPGLALIVIANRRRVKLGTFLSIAGPLTGIACAVAAVNLFAMRLF